MRRIGARRLFYGPINQVVPPATAARWVDALLGVKGSDEAIASMAQHTGDSSRDVPPATLNLARRALGSNPELLAVLEGERERDAGEHGPRIRRGTSCWSRVCCVRVKELQTVEHSGSR